MLEKTEVSLHPPSLNIDSRSSTPEEKIKEVSEKLDTLDQQASKSVEATELPKISS